MLLLSYEKSSSILFRHLRQHSQQHLRPISAPRREHIPAQAGWGAWALLSPLWAQLPHGTPSTKQLHSRAPQPQQQSNSQNYSLDISISGNVEKGSVPLPFCFVWACEFIKKLAIHFHQRFQHVVHQCHNGSETEVAQPLDLLVDKVNFREQACDFFLGFWASYSRYYCKVKEFLKQNPFHFINLQRKL